MITVESKTSWADLENLIRHTPLLHEREGVKVYPYMDAQITLELIQYDDVRPTSLYALSDNIAVQQRLTHDLLPNYDPLNLEGGLRLINDDGNEVGLIPPIVEETTEAGMYLLDGLHRAYLGRLAGRTAFVAIHIVGFRDDCPAAALPNEWEEVIVYDSVPSNPSLKRRYRDDPLSLRRDFSPLNGSQPRL